jgi:hypothetical protein
MPSPRSRLVSIRFSHGASLSAWPYSEAAVLGLGERRRDHARISDERLQEMGRY